MQMRHWVLVFGLLGAASAWAQDDMKADKAQLAKLDKEYRAAKTSFEKSPKNASLKKKYVAATVKLGTATMTSISLAPKDKYPPALRLYREALKHDPKNVEAKNNLEMIESIYRQMGRPIPK
jgi:tetratricopeptide (TPR) repeat protein